jgi:hypothetical protein
MRDEVPTTELWRAAMATITISGDDVPRSDQKIEILHIYNDLVKEWKSEMKEAVRAGCQPYFVGNPDFPLAFIVYKHKELFSDWMFYQPASSLFKGVISSLNLTAIPLAISLSPGDLASGVVQAGEQLAAFDKNFWSQYHQAAWCHLQSSIIDTIDHIFSYIYPYQGQSNYYQRYVEEPVIKALKTRDLQKARLLLKPQWYTDFTSHTWVNNGKTLTHDQVFKRLCDTPIASSSYGKWIVRMVWYQVFNLPYDDNPQKIKTSMIQTVRKIAELMTTTYNAYKAQVMAEIKSSGWMAAKKSFQPFGLPIGTLWAAGSEYPEFEQRFRKDPDRLVNMVRQKINISLRLHVIL